MVGKIHMMITTLLEKRAGGKPYLVASEKIKLIMKGVDPDQYRPQSDDDPAVISRLHAIAREMSVEL